jgi:glucans biosynthesis protein
LHRKNVFNHILVFAGASYFRAVGKDNVFGLSARGLAIDTGLPSGEEFPFFKEFWLERPAATAREMKFFGLLDSRSITGAYEFVVRPGEKTTVAVRAKLFGRAPVKELGIAPLTSMFFYGESKPRPAGEWRPEVHDSDGLLMRSGAGEWIWRPLGNPEKLRVSYFGLTNPRGFGLFQRDRNFDHYEDLETRHELRPNAWIIPAGNWGKGQVKLVEIPSRKETNDNIVAYWLPHSSISAKGPFDIAYRIEFNSIDPVGASLGRTTAMRIGNGDKKEWKRIIVDFEGGKIKSLPAGAPLEAMIDVGPEGRLMQHGLIKNPVTQGWRLSFQVETPKEKTLELRASLRRQQDVLTETWSYQPEP